MEAGPAQAATDPPTFTTRASAIFDGNLGPEANKIRLPRPVTRLALLAPVFGQLSTGLWTPEGVAKYVCLAPAEQLGEAAQVHEPVGRVNIL